MQKFIDSDEYNVLIMNLPPRHGKSRTAQLFTQWLLGNRPNTKIMTGSYNETLSKMFSKSVRNAIQEVKADDDITVFSDVFPSVRVATGDAQAHLWSIEGQTNSYLATSPTGTATGFGCSLMIIDDIIKNSEEAYNANVKESHWDWFTNTMLSRLEEGGKIIIIMTRWASDDLAGRAIEHFQDDPL
ncbi:MAG: terminase, partial [Veillonella caviae]|nr:terminase [Veillonella caviae]